MAEYITDLEVSLTVAEESLYRDQGYTQLPGNLNSGTKGKQIFLWFKKGKADAITRIQFSFCRDMTLGLIQAGYTKIEKDLNTGAGGDTIHLWYYKGSSASDVPITDLAVTLNNDSEVQRYKSGWKRLACDTNRNAGGNWIYLFVRRAKPVYISDITASGSFNEDNDRFQKGYIRVDEDTNKKAGGSFVFIWYQLTTDDKQALKAPLKVSTNNDEYQNYKQQGYKLVNQDLNEGTGGNRIFLWTKHNSGNPIRDVSVINEVDMEAFEKAGINVITKNLNGGNDGQVQYVCFT
ncbi:uncharacterized protein LOC114866988 [Betta splendens]|uniref:Uncharacterized protein LOC114866988 n=1 Tax=Betta splendens TaxID=158456 RepID=A0A9W2Y5S9_BETSP|nr:uncharacterized protein LOC114866988 [Betta splendens]